MLLKLALGSQHSEFCQHLENLALSAWGGKEFFFYKWEEWISLQQHLYYPFLCEIENSHASSEASWCSQTTDGKARGALWVVVGCWQLLETSALPEQERTFQVHPASGYKGLSSYWSQCWWVCAVQGKQFCSWVYWWNASNRRALTEPRYTRSGTRAVPWELVGPRPTLPFVWGQMKLRELGLPHSPLSSFWLPAGSSGKLCRATEEERVGEAWLPLLKVELGGEGV